MSRVVSLYLPSWSTDRLKRAKADSALLHNDGVADSDRGLRADASLLQSLVLVGREGRKRVVIAAI